MQLSTLYSIYDKEEVIPNCGMIKKSSNHIWYGMMTTTAFINCTIMIQLANMH